MKLEEAVRQRLRRILQDNHYNQYKISKDGGVPKSTVSQVLSGKNGKIKLDTLYQIVAALDISLAEFFNDPLFNDLID